MTTYMPGSKIPFKPLNPWGRAMPKPAREMRRDRPSLYQLRVTNNATGEKILVGPKVVLELAERLCIAANVMISRGKETAWSNPEIVEYRQESPAQPGSKETLGDLLRRL